MNHAKRLFYIYQKVWYVITQAKAELLKPMGLWNETVLIVTYLTVKGFDVSVKEIALGYILILFVLFVFGMILRWAGVIAYNKRLENQQNPEIVDIITRLERIEQTINKKNGSV